MAGARTVRRTILLLAVVVAGGLLYWFGSRPRHDTEAGRKIAGALIIVARESDIMNVLANAKLFPELEALHINGAEGNTNRLLIYSFRRFAGFTVFKGYEVVRQPTAAKASWRFSCVYSVDGPVIKRIRFRRYMATLPDLP